MATHYTPISELISSADSLPEEIKNLFDDVNLLQSIYYKNFSFLKKADGSGIVVNMDLVILKDLSFGSSSGFRVILNPDFSDPTAPSLLPLKFSAEWPILKYTSVYDLTSFLFNSQSYFNLYHKISNLSDSDIIKNLFDTSFIGVIPSLEVLATILNASPYSFGIPQPLSTDVDIASDTILQYSAQNKIDIKEVIFEQFIEDLDPVIEESNLLEMLRTEFPTRTKESIKDYFIPILGIEAEVSLGLEIPRKVLKPMSLISGSEATNNAVYAVDETITTGSEMVKTTLLFEAGSLFYKTNIGLGFDKDFVLTMSHPRAQIGKSPFNVGFSEARYETYEVGQNPVQKETKLSIESAFIGFNIDTEGSGKDFKLYGEKIIIDSGNGFSGVLGIEPGDSLSHTFSNDIYIELTTFELEFSQDKVVHSSITGIMRIPGFDIDGVLVDIQITLNFYSDGFEIIAQVPSPVSVVDNAIFEVKLQHFEIGRRDALWKLKYQGKLINNIDIPFANKFIPKEFDIQNLSWTQGEGVDYSIGLIWENGLNILVSNEGPPQFTEFRKRFEIAKKKEDGFFKLDAIELVIKPESPEGISAALELYGAQFNIGKKVSFTIDGLGLKATLTEAPSGNGAIGPFNTSFEITGPKGIGVTIDAGKVQGTGYLYIDDNEYRGLVQLEISGKFTITAIAVLNTKMPDGEKGNSFITIISVTGLNIQLGMGFLLDGLGGVLGIHRTMDTQFLKDGIRNGTMDSLMFPANVQENLTQIITDIKSVYPMKRDQFIFGPMAKLYWGGVKAIVIADLAILIEFSDPTRLIVLGKAVIGIVVGNFDLIVIQVGVLAELNFTEKKLMIDASIYNSNLLFFTLEGDMALRLYWGAEKAFLLTVGGFHPDYKPSDNMKVNNVRRMKIALLNDNPRLTVEAYFAVTSNTVQFGAAVDFYFEIKGFSVKGGFGFDCLFQFNPFQFTVGVYAFLGIYKGSSELMGISLSGSLKGTTPWSISGSVEFKLLCIKVKGRVDKTWGDNKNTSLPAVKVDDLVIAAMNDDKSWQTSIPDLRYFLVGLNDNSKIAEDASGDPALLMSPMSTLTIKQDVVPLDVSLNHYYNQKVSGNNKFAINDIIIGADTYSGSALAKTKTDFAPAQYFNYTDKQKLSKSSFETMVNGVSLNGNGDLQADHVVDMEYNYDMTLYDGTPANDPDWLWSNERNLDPNVDFAHDYFSVDEFVKGGFIANNAQSKTNRFQSETVEGNVVNVNDDYVIVNKNTFDAHDNDMATYSAADLSAAEDLVSELLLTDPDLEGELMVVQKHELV